MDFKGMFDFSSKMVWLGVAMIAAGTYQQTGIDIPVLPEHELLSSLFPENGATLIKAGFAMLFIKTRVDKASVAN